ncbi:MAG TPA: tyrosine-type recombinase/integrase [Anaerovoracaceae bacterium]|nr:tyrosine-type recombinase/integrase [Anaerovoracaceae bacterium]
MIDQKIITEICTFVHWIQERHPEINVEISAFNTEIVREYLDYREERKDVRKMGNVNLFQQMKMSVDDAFSPGMSKRSVKMDETQNTKDHIFAYETRSDLINTSHQLADYVKTNHPDVKYVKDITRDMAKEFLDSKHHVNGGSCNSNSVNTYAQRLDNLAHVCNLRFRDCNVGWDIDKKELYQDKDKLRDLRMDPEHLNDALRSMTECHGKFAVEIAREFGLRESSIVHLRGKDFHFDEMKMVVYDAKHGKTFKIELREDQAEWIKAKMEEKGIGLNDRLVPIRAQSVANILREHLESAGHKQYIDAKSSIHAVRKMVAQQHYEAKIAEYQAKGEEFKTAEKHALRDTSLYLGHGDTRTIPEYVVRKRLLTKDNTLLLLT